MMESASSSADGTAASSDPRDQGDGADSPDMFSGDGVTGARAKPHSKPFTVHMEVDLVQWMLFSITLATRMWKLQQPNAVVFDELFYGRFVGLYAKQTFFFDAQPPLGKLLYAAIGYWAGFDAEVSFDKIGAAYPPGVPVWYMRSISAVLGSLVVPVVYQVMVELQLMRWTAAITASMVILDTALLTQSRLILMEGPLILCIVTSLLCFLKFSKENLSRPLTVHWWAWLAGLGVCIGLSISIKYSAALTCLLLVVLVAWDYWKMLALITLSDMQLVKHLAARMLMLVLVPAVLYVSVFYVHLSVLFKAGPHDDVMTSAFQASLEGGLASITKGQPLEVAYGSQVTLRHTYGERPCWLHSHPQLYPLRYADGRGSSHQQQVTCYTFKDVNNWWIIKDPMRSSVVVEDPIRPVRDGDIVQVLHGISSRALNSHDVAAPVSPQTQEVTCYIDYNISFPAQNLWKVEIVNKEAEGDLWHTIKSHVRLVHVNTTSALKTSGRHLPDWGYYQYEVVADKLIGQDATVWNVEEHRYTRSVDVDDRENELQQMEMIPLSPTKLNFWQKFWELQLKMLLSSPEQLEHRYSSTPLDWPLIDQNIAYWYDPVSNAQIHLLGNAVLWYTGSLATAVYGVLLGVYLLRRRRACWDISEDHWHRFTLVGLTLTIGYLINYLPYFMTETTLFLYHYLPALVFSFMLTGALAEHIYLLIGSPVVQWLFTILVMAWWLSVVKVFLVFQRLCYGIEPLSEEDVAQIKWKDSWEFLLPARYK